MYRNGYQRYGGRAGFNIGRINHVKINNPKPFPAPPPTPFDLRGVRHAHLQEKHDKADKHKHANNENKAPPIVIPPRTKYRTPTKKERFLRSLKTAFTPPEAVNQAQAPGPSAAPAPATPSRTDSDSDPHFPGALIIPAPPVGRDPYFVPEFGEEAAKHWANKLRQLPLDDEDAHVLRVFEALKIQGQTRERYHENAVALDVAAELQPQREKFRALDCAAAAKREKLYQRRLAEAREREEQERRKEEQRKLEEERRRQEREDANNRRIAEMHRMRQEERIAREKQREEERLRREREQKERMRLAAEARRVEAARLAKEAAIQRERERELREARERQEFARLRAEREAATRRQKEQEERARQAVLAERRAALEALRQATREAKELIARLERDQQAKDEFIRAAEYRAHLMEQELLARERQQWAQAQALFEQLQQAYCEHAMLDQAFREAQQRAFFEQQQRAAQEAQERAAREAQERAQREQQEAAARAAQEAQKQAEEAHKVAVQKYVCEMYDHKWNLLKTEKNLVGQVPYYEFPIPVFPFVPQGATELPASPQPGTITREQVREFVLSPYRTSMASKAARERVRAEILLWHPDKFQSKFMHLVRPEDQPVAKEAVDVLCRILTQIKEDLENEQWAAKEAKEAAEKAKRAAA